MRHSLRIDLPEWLTQFVAQWRLCHPTARLRDHHAGTGMKPRFLILDDNEVFAATLARLRRDGGEHGGGRRLAGRSADRF